MTKSNSLKDGNFLSKDFCASLEIGLHLIGHHIAKASKRHLDDYLLTSGFPELLQAPKNIHKRILQEYFESICYRDIVERYEIKNPIAVKDLAFSLASQHSQLVTVNKLFERLKSIGHKVQKNFVTDILFGLQDSYSFFNIPIWSESRAKQNVNPKKTYCIDSGLVTAIRAGISQNHGRLLEGVIFCELLRREHNVFYFKTELGLEIDFISQDSDEQLHLIQVCSELSIENLEREVKPFLEIRSDKRFKGAKYILVCGAKVDARLNIPSFIKAIPAWEFLLEK